MSCDIATPDPVQLELLLLKYQLYSDWNIQQCLENTGLPTYRTAMMIQVDTGTVVWSYS